MLHERRCLTTARLGNERDGRLRQRKSTATASWPALRAASMRYFRRWRVIGFRGYRLVSDPSARASGLHLLAAVKEVGRVMELDSKEGTSSAEEPIQFPLKLGLRFSTKARTASLWSRVCAVLTIFSAS